MVTSRIFEWNALEADLFKLLYSDLVNLDMEYREGKVYLKDIEDL